MTSHRPATGGGSISRSTVLATIATMAGFATTLVQQLFYARVLGVGADTDALAAALVLAVSVCGLLGSMFASLVIPGYARSLRADPIKGRAVFRTANAALAVIGVAAAVFAWLLSDQLAVALLPGSPLDIQKRLAALLRISAPLYALWPAVMSLTALCNARERYVVAAAATVVPSVPVIIVLALPGSSVERTLAAYSVGALAQLCVLFWATRPWLADLMPLPSTAGVEALRGRVLPVLLAFAAMSATALVARAIASLGGTGDVAAFDYATRLAVAGEQVLLNGALAVMLTTWSADASTPDSARLPLLPTFQFLTGLAIAAAAALALFGKDLVEVVFGGGNFTKGDVEMVGAVLAWSAPGFAGRVLLLTAVRVFLARGSVWVLALIGLSTLVTISAVGMLAQPRLGVLGVGVAYSVTWAAAGIGALILSLDTHFERIAVAREALAAFAATAVAAVAGMLALSVVGSAGWMRLLAGAAAFLTIGALAGWLLHVHVVRTCARALARVQRRFTKGT